MEILGKTYKHLFHPLEVKEGPAGLYAEPRIWADGNDWEGYQGHFSYGFFKAPAVCHPLEGAVVHPYDEILVFAGTNLSYIRDLAGEVSIELGPEREEYVFTESTVVLIPKGMVHGPARIRRADKPIAHYLFGLDPEYKAEAVVPSALAATATTGTKYSHLVKSLKTYATEQQLAAAAASPETFYELQARIERMLAEGRVTGTGMGYEEMLDKNGVIHPRDIMGPGNGDSICWMFGPDLEGFDFNFAWGFFSGCGKWHRPGEGHTHPETEALLYLGLRADDLGYLGAELHMEMGPEFEKNVFDRPMCIVAPAGFIHLPTITRWVDDPYVFMVGCLAGVHEAPWVHPEDLE